MEEIPTFYSELTEKVMDIKRAIPHATEQELIRSLHNLYVFCLGAISQKTDDDAKELMKAQNRRLQERISEMRDRVFKEAEGRTPATATLGKAMDKVAKNP